MSGDTEPIKNSGSELLTRYTEKVNYDVLTSNWASGVPTPALDDVPRPIVSACRLPPDPAHSLVILPALTTSPVVPQRVVRPKKAPATCRKGGAE